MDYLKKPKKKRFCCIVENCPGSDEDKINFHRFPENSHFLELWCANVGISVKEVYSTTRICSRHFDTVFRGEKKLKFGALPTLNLTSPVVKFNSESQNIKVRKCVIPTCCATRPPSTLFSFPQNKQKRLEWIKICGLQNKSHIKYLLICPEHFEPDMMIGNKLKHNAFPKQQEIFVKKEAEIEMKDCDEFLICPEQFQSDIMIESKLEQNEYPNQPEVFVKEEEEIEMKDCDEFLICSEQFEPDLIIESKLKQNECPNQQEVFVKEEKEIEIKDCEELLISSEQFEPDTIIENKLKYNEFPIQQKVFIEKEEEIEITDFEKIEDTKIAETVEESSSSLHCDNCDKYYCQQVFYKKEIMIERSINKAKTQEITKLKRKVAQLHDEIEMWKDKLREANKNAVAAENT